MPILMTTVEAGGNVLLPYWSKIHYERLVDSWVNDGERSIHHKSMPTVLGTYFWLLFSFSPLWFSFSLLLINTKPVGIREQTFWLKSDSTSLHTLLLKGTLNRFFFIRYLFIKLARSSLTAICTRQKNGNPDVFHSDFNMSTLKVWMNETCWMNPSLLFCFPGHWSVCAGSSRTLSRAAVCRLHGMPRDLSGSHPSDCGEYDSYSLLALL